MHSLKLFLKQSLNNFVEVGAFFPSSRFLAKRIVKHIENPIVLELGPGTGVFTKEILKKLPQNGILVSIESNEEFVRYLQNKIKDKRLKLYNGDARLMKNYLKKNNLEKVGCIISGLPLGNFKKEISTEILNEASECLSEDGIYIQFQYVLADLINIKRVFPSIKLSYELFNFPPAFVIKCKKN